jgi:hypothetical protein
MYWTGSGTVGEFQPWVGLPNWCTPNPAGDLGFIPPPADIGQLRQASLNQMMPLVKAELSLVNSLIELKDFVNLPRTILHVVGVASKFLGSRNQLGLSLTQVSHLLKAKRTRLRVSGLVKDPTLMQYVRAASDTFLQWKFNIAPLVSDISGIRTALSKTHERINKLVRLAETLRTVHFSKHLSEYVSTTIDSGSYGLGPSDYWDPPFYSARVIREVAYKQSLFHAECEYSYSYSDFQLKYKELLALLDGLGVQWNPAIVWNAIPFSFLVDWLLGVSRWLSTIKEENMRPRIVIRRYLWSIKRERVIRGRLISYRASSPSSGSTVTILPVVNETAYRRDNTMPAASSFTTSGLNLNEISLGVALAFARKRVRKPRGVRLPS